MIDDLASCRVEKVLAAGKLVTDASFAKRKPIAPVGRNSIKAKPVYAAQLQVLGSGENTPVIGVTPGRIITQFLRRKLPTESGVVAVDLSQDVIKVAVIERHGVNGNVKAGFVSGFGLLSGAIGSTVGHDCHNITLVGVNDEDMALAANRLREIEGGFVVVRGGKVLAEMPLPIAGLMSDRSYEDVRSALQPLRLAAKSLGTRLSEPFLQVAFLPLPVIPHLKITDKGIVDVDKFAFIES